MEFSSSIFDVRNLNLILHKVVRISISVSRTVHQKSIFSDSSLLTMKYLVYSGIWCGGRQYHQQQHLASELRESRRVTGNPARILRPPRQGNRSCRHSKISQMVSHMQWWVQLYDNMQIMQAYQDLTNGLPYAGVSLYDIHMQITQAFQDVKSADLFDFLPHIYCNICSHPNYLLTYLLTYSMEQSPSWEANQ